MKEENQVIYEVTFFLKKIVYVLLLTIFVDYIFLCAMDTGSSRG